MATSTTAANSLRGATSANVPAGRSSPGVPHRLGRQQRTVVDYPRLRDVGDEQTHSAADDRDVTFDAVDVVDLRDGEISTLVTGATSPARARS